MNGVSVIDADGHVLETDAELEQYFEGSYKGHKRSGVFSIFPSLDGWPRGFVRGLEKINRTGADNWIQFIEGSKIDAAVLYPTAGLSLGLIQDPDWACVVARTYNNWLHDRYCKVDPRLKGVALLPVHDPQEAAIELRHAVKEQGMVAGLLPAVTMLNKGYGHRDFHPIYKEAQELNVPLTVHGAVSRGLGFDFLQTMSMIHTLEHPIAQMIQLTSIVLDGVFDLFPKLRIGFLGSRRRLDSLHDGSAGREVSHRPQAQTFSAEQAAERVFQERQHLRHLRDRRENSRRRRPRNG